MYVEYNEYGSLKPVSHRVSIIMLFGMNVISVLLFKATGTLCRGEFVEQFEFSFSHSNSKLRFQQHQIPLQEISF